MGYEGTAAVSLDEPVTFGTVKPLYFTLHKARFLLRIYFKELTIARFLYFVK